MIEKTIGCICAKLTTRPYKSELIIDLVNLSLLLLSN